MEPRMRRRQPGTEGSYKKSAMQRPWGVGCSMGWGNSRAGVKVPRKVKEEGLRLEVS